MKVSYDRFTEAFLSKITEYNFLALAEEDRQALVDGYMKRAASKFSEVCKFNIAEGNDEDREYDFDNATYDEVEEIVDIVTDGMLEQWLRQHLYKQENLENMLNTADFSHYSPAELTYRITNAYKMCKKDYISRIREYSYRYGDLTDLHL